MVRKTPHQGSATLGGVVNFGELASLSDLQRLVFAGGCVLLFCGVGVLSGRRQRGLSPASKWRMAGAAVRFIVRARTVARAARAVDVELGAQWAAAVDVELGADR
jgi:hypothetical protein